LGEGFTHLNETSVILLFARIMDDLGIIYESSPPSFPDSDRGRRVGNTWQKIRIEFEIQK
jgi:hypothetical protein